MAAAVVLSSITLDKPKELEFKFWLRLSEKWLRHLRRTRVVAAAAVFFVIIKPTLVSTSTSTWTRVWQLSYHFCIENASVKAWFLLGLILCPGT